MLMRRLGTYSNKLARVNGPEHFKHARNQRAKCFDSVVDRNHHNDCDGQGRQVLLKLQVLIAGKQDLELPACFVQQRSILEP